MATFHEHFKSYQASVKFYDEIFTFENFSIFSVFACIFRPLFNINDQYLADYLFLQQIITFGCIFSCAMVGFFYQKVNSANKTLIWFILLISLIIFTFSFMFYESPTIGYSWMSIPIILYCYQTFQYGHRDDRLSNNILLTIVMCFTALDVDLTLITILLLLFNFCYLSIKNHNPIGQSLYCAFPFLYVFFLWMPLFSAVPYAVLLTICLISALIMVLLYSQYIFRKIIMNINKLAYRHPIFIICFISVVIYTLSFFFFVTIFNYHFSWRLWPENYSYIFGINLQKYPNFNLYFNVGSWIVLGGILTAIITYAVTKKNHLSSQPYLFLMLLMILLFINPLTLNLFSKITENNHFKLLDLGLINFLLIFPSILWFGETISGKPMFMLKRKSYEACTN
ncbi:MAG: hypothetical protein LBD63_03630 [Mycoplasmataceae bacterium]|nr:hypothetical protein [Mycoplasmataceae bacterium]